MNGYTNIVSMMLAALALLVPGLGRLVGGGPTAAVDEQTVRRTLPWSVSGGEHTLELSNINGSVHIVVEARQDVSVVAIRTVEHQGAASDPGPALDFRSDAGRALVCGDSTHCGCHIEGPRGSRRGDDDLTRVRVDFDVRVPRGAVLDVCAVNGGRLTVEGVDGRFTLRNVNGDVELVGMRGAGRASTVNGSVHATFVDAPDGPADFRTVNGAVDVTMPASLSADLRLKTMHGGIYTDFDTTPLPSQPTRTRRDGKFIYRADRSAAVRVGKGGPELSFETLNGDVQVRKR